MKYAHYVPLKNIHTVNACPVFENVLTVMKKKNLIKVKVKSSMARSLPEENLLPQNVGSIINYLQ